MNNESIHSEIKFYLFPEEQNKYGLFVFFFIHTTCDITLSINFSYITRPTDGFMNWKHEPYGIDRPGSVRIGNNCALGLENDLGHSFSLSGPRGR